MRPDTLGVIGLGAIGGSVAWQARSAGIGVLGWSPQPAERVRAVQLGALDDAPARPEDVARRADLLVLAAPPHANEELLARLAPALGDSSLVTDVATVKCGIAKRAEQLGLGPRFAGSHPFVTTRGRGFEAARSDLFVQALVYVCPTGDAVTAAREVVHFWESVLGATTVVIDPRRHDVQAAWTCHLPPVIAAALCIALDGQLHPGASVGESMRDLTRAAADPSEGAAALLANADNIVAALDAFAGELLEWRSLLARNDRDVSRRLDQAAAWRQRVGA